MTGIDEMLSKVQKKYNLKEHDPESGCNKIVEETHVNRACNTQIARAMASHMARTPKDILEHASDSVDGFFTFWKEQRAGKDFSTPDEYIENINAFFSSYSSLRLKLDGSIAFILGDFLLECRSKFFPMAEKDRKEAGRWSEFLERGLCAGFSRSTAYLCIQAAKDFPQFRERNLTLRKIKMIASVKSKGLEVSDELTSMSEADIRKFIENHSSMKRKLAPSKKQSINRFHLTLSMFKQTLENFDSDDFYENKDDLRRMEVDLNFILSSIRSYIK